MGAGHMWNSEASSSSMCHPAGSYTQCILPEGTRDKLLRVILGMWATALWKHAENSPMCSLPNLSVWTRPTQQLPCLVPSHPSILAEWFENINVHHPWSRGPSHDLVKEPLGEYAVLVISKNSVYIPWRAWLCNKPWVGIRERTSFY